MQVGGGRTGGVEDPRAGTRGADFEPAAAGLEAFCGSDNGRADHGERRAQREGEGRHRCGGGGRRRCCGGLRSR